ncbi:aldo/keto reductase [Ganoderma leucocontextum]|nr:aldo/keto reductase [Ganoderma leucocontextum]
MTTTTTKLGGTAVSVVVAKVAHGLMGMTSSTPVPDEQAFQYIKSGIDVLPEGVKLILNSAEFYGHGWTTGKLELLARFFQKHKDYADKTFLSVKGGAAGFGKINGKADGLHPQKYRQVARGAESGARRRSTCACPPASIPRPIEDTVRYLVELLREGKFDYIGLSECRADTMWRGHVVYPISVVEIENCPTSYEEEMKIALAAPAELDIAVAANSPLGHGLITGNIRGVDDLPAGSWIRDLTRLKDENLPSNLRPIDDALHIMAAKKNCTPAQLSIAWVGALGEKVIPLPGSTRKEHTLGKLQGGDIALSKQDIEEIAQILEALNPVKGDRYFGDAVDLAVGSGQQYGVRNKRKSIVNDVTQQGLNRLGTNSCLVEQLI